MVSLVINSLSRWQRTNYAAESSGDLPQGRQDIRPRPTRTSRMKSRADAQAVGKRSGIGAEYEAERAQTKAGASGGPAEERMCTRGRGMRLLKIGSPGLRCEDSDGMTIFEWIRLRGI